jgi:hypothetical protein
VWVTCPLVGTKAFFPIFYAADTRSILGALSWTVKGHSIHFQEVQMLSVRHITVSLAALAIYAGVGSAQVTTSNPGLPPDTGAYLSPQQVHADYSGPGLAIVLSQVSHQPFANSVKYQDDTATGTETESFDSQATGMVSVNGSPNVPLTLTGPVSVDAFGKVGNVTGTFNTQMLSMDLTGTVLGNSVQIMLDPANPTFGQTSIIADGPGLYTITSFFDVFTELSLNGSPFIPQNNGPTLVTLEPVPEPASVGLLGAGVFALLRRRPRNV